MKKIYLLILLILNTTLNSDIINGSTDPVGRPRDLSINPIYVGFDHSQTTSIKNHTLTHLSGSEVLVTFTTSSHLVLEDSTLSLDSSFTFSHGTIEITGDVSIEGSGKEFYFNSVFLQINTGSTLRIGNGVTFIYTPTSTTKFGIQFEDSTSIFKLDSATLKIDNNFGLHLSDGVLEVNGNSIIDNTSTDTNQALILGFGTSRYLDCKLKINSGSELNIQNAGIISRNIGPTGIDTSSGSIKIDPESNFIIEEELDLADSSLKINNSTLSSKIGTGPIESILDPETYYKELFVVINGIEWRPQNDIIAVAEKFNVGDGVSQLVLYDETLTTTLATNADRAGERIANWDPYGRYIATCTNDGNKVVYLYDQANGNILYVFYIMNNGDVDSFGIEFSPDGRFIAIPEIDAGAPTYLINIYKFIPEETTKLELVDTISDDSKSAFWSPNGKYLGLINIDSDTLEIYRFNGSSATFVDSASSNVGTAVHTGRVWSPNNRHFAVTRTTEPYIEVYEFDGTTATLVASDSTNIGVGVVWWSYDGKAIAVGANDGCLTVYSFDGSSLTPLEIGGSPSPVDLGQPIRNLAFSRDSEFIGLAKDVDGGSNLAEISLHKNMFSTKQAITSFTSTTSLGILKLNKSLKLKDIQLNLG